MKKTLIQKIYLDVCTLCRPYDNQRAMRIRLETDAMFLIMESIRKERYNFLVSPVHIQEINGIEDLQERMEINEFRKSFGTKGIIKNNSVARQQTEELYSKGLGIADAAHLVFAQTCADCLISCDDRFVKRARKLRPNFLIMGPVEFCEREKLQ